MERGFFAEIDLRAISHNFRVIRQIAESRPVIAVVKADAYGHGAVEVSKRLLGEGAGYLAVAFTDEARVLRESGITAPILVLFDPDAHDAFAYNLTPAVGTMQAAKALSREAERTGRPISIHIKVDTGMGRLGFRGPDQKDIQRAILEIAHYRGITIEGIMSHFSEADLADRSFAQTQISAFIALRNGLAAAGLSIPLCHLANSAALMALPESHLDALRPGIMLYGYSPFVGKMGTATVFSAKKRSLSPFSLIPAMSVRARMVALRKLPPGTPVSYGRTFITERESLIGVVAAGYADGFNRLFSNTASVLVRGKRVPVVGRVCMDVTMIDVTDIGEVAETDEVVIMGSQGGERISAADLAQWSDTIPYETLISFGSKAKRTYIR